MPTGPLTLISLIDLMAAAIFLGGWVGYGYFADTAARSARGLRGVTHLHRVRWARELVRRENRITDAALIGNLMNSVAFYANTSIYIVAGLIAVLGTLDKLVSVASDLPFARVASRELVELKLLVLAGIFVFAYFKFTWCMRQFNFLSILVGAAPPPSEPEVELERFAHKHALLNTLAGDEFNRGIRAYYFGFAAVSWFVSPLALIAVTSVILVILYRRDFHSATLHALSGGH